MFQTALMLINNQIIKEPIFQTVSKNGLRLSEKQKTRAFTQHTTYFEIGGFIRATACFNY
mgnify:FL=1